MANCTYYVITVAVEHVRYSYAMRIPHHLNLWSILSDMLCVMRIETLNACDTKRQAIASAAALNESWKEQGCLWENPRVCHAIWR